VLYPLKPSGADLPQIGHGISSLAKTVSGAIFHVPRREVKEIPHALHSKDLEYEDKRRLFVETVLPLVLMENERIEHTREKMLYLLKRIDQGDTVTLEDREWLRELAKEYRLTDNPVSDAARRELRKRVDIIPVDLALAQAAVETGWGRSRYVRTQRDLFGMTGFRPAHSTKASRKGKGRRYRAPKFATLRDSVRIYIHTLNTHPAYKNLRVIRAKLREKGQPLRGIPIAEGLGKYSVLGKTYIRAVRKMIRNHDLERYTVVRLRPATQHHDPTA
jgi:Bax protein